MHVGPPPFLPRCRGRTGRRKDYLHTRRQQVQQQTSLLAKAARCEPCFLGFPRTGLVTPYVVYILRDTCFCGEIVPVFGGEVS